MSDVTQLILDDHDAFRRAFARLDEVRGDAAAALREWEPLADFLEVHASAEEEHFYPALLRAADPDGEETKDAVGDHDDIRDGIRRAAAAEPGSDGWWKAVDDARAANTEHMGEEEDEGLADFRRHSTLEQRAELGRSFLAFKADHPRAAGLSGEDKDPEAYVAEHS